MLLIVCNFDDSSFHCNPAGSGDFCSKQFLLLSYKLSFSFFLYLLSFLKGLGHAILGNFSTDQIVIELT